MKAIILVFSDGVRHLSRVVPSDFDTQAWANGRAQRGTWKMLEVVKIIEEYVNE